MYRKFSSAMTALALALVIVTSGCIHSHHADRRAVVAVPAERIIVTEAPPPEKVEAVGIAPDNNLVWISGYWMRGDNRWIWVPGHWDARPRSQATWVPGSWEKDTSAKGWFWKPGHWE